MTAFLRWPGAIGSGARNVSNTGDCKGVGPKHDALETSYSHLRPNLQAVSVSSTQRVRLKIRPTLYSVHNPGLRGHIVFSIYYIEYKLS